MWLLAIYEATTLFSLKPSDATSSGGRTLLAPTPYAIKMGLLDAAYRRHGADEVAALWPTLRDLRLAHRPPLRAVANNVFTRILKPSRSSREPGSWPLQRTIGYREYVHYQGPWGLALGLPEPLPWVAELAGMLAYAGKRGGFLQLLHAPTWQEDLPTGYCLLSAQEGAPVFKDGVLQVMDDCGPDLTLERASIYSGKNLRAQDRLAYPVVLPYRLARSSRDYTLYERLDG
ncbi:MAG: hypothetical protein ACOX2R_00380 [Anaerolineae bacterium]